MSGALRQVAKTIRETGGGDRNAVAEFLRLLKVEPVRIPLDGAGSGWTGVIEASPVKRKKEQKWLLECQIEGERIQNSEFVWANCNGIMNYLEKEGLSGVYFNFGEVGIDFQTWFMRGIQFSEPSQIVVNEKGVIRVKISPGGGFSQIINVVPKIKGGLKNEIVWTCERINEVRAFYLLTFAEERKMYTQSIMMLDPDLKEEEQMSISETVMEILDKKDVLNQLPCWVGILPVAWKKEVVAFFETISFPVWKR